MTTTVNEVPPVAAPAARTRRPWLQAAAPATVLAVMFVALAIPPYLTGDPSQSRVPTHPEHAWYYPVLVAHIVFGSVALVAGTLQLWPWLRQRHAVAHRWIGRAYFFGGVFPAGVAVLAITPLASTGTVSVAANMTLALLWLPITIAGYRMARQRRYREHRRWMIRSYALTTSIALNRIWGFATLALLSPSSLERENVAGSLLAPDDHTGMAAIGVANWLSWIVNLLIAEWWLERTDFGVRRRGAAAK